MAHRRVIYALVLGGVFLFQITNENYLAHFLLGLCIALPLLSLALSLPGMRTCRVELTALPAALDRGEPGRWTMEVDAFAGLPLARLTLRLTTENLLTGQRDTRRMKLTGVAKRRPVELAARTDHCGLLELRVDRLRVCDYLGLFTLPLAPPPPARMLCRPIPAQRRPVDVPDGMGTPSPRNAQRLGPGEDYDLREYRPGDPMRSVHWKLSSKWDELIVRERAEAVTPLPLFTIDRFGKPEELDRLLDQLTGLSRAMLNVQRPHAVLWLDQAGEPRLHLVCDEREYALFLTELLTGPAPLTGPAVDGLPELSRRRDSAMFRVHVTPEGGDSHD